MKRFNFRLEKLLELRKFYEHRAELELAHAVSRKAAIDIALKTVAQLKLETNRKFVAGGTAPDINYLYSAQHYMIRLDKEKEELLSKLVLAEQAVNEKRAVYIEAASKRKAISKLKEKKMALWRKENIKAEDNIIDDLVTFRSGKRLSEAAHRQ